jgi:hypothetical protein
LIRMESILLIVPVEGASCALIPQSRSPKSVQ